MAEQGFVQATEDCQHRWNWSEDSHPADTVIHKGDVIKADDPIVAVYPDKFRPYTYPPKSSW